MATDGERETKVIFERSTRVEDAHGSLGEPEWAEHCTEWALVLYGTGAERREAAQRSASQPATLTVPANEKTRALKATDRARFAEVIWEIVGVVPIIRSGEMAITVIGD